MSRVLPTTMELERFLFASGMMAATPTIPQQYLDYQLALDAAYQDWKGDLKLPFGHPFLAESTATMRYYDSPGGRHVQIPPYFTISYVTTASAFSTSSETKTLQTDYLLFPQGDPPYRELIWAGYYNSQPQTIGVNGRRGWSDDLPADVFLALMQKAAFDRLQPSISAAINNGAISWQEGDVSERYGSSGAFSTSAQKAMVNYWNTVNNYKQTRVYGAGRDD